MPFLPLLGNSSAVAVPLVDASSPARVTAAAGATPTTAAFNPPACILLALVGADGATANTFTISNNGTALTWTEIDTRNFADAGTGGAVAAYWAELTAGRTGMTVTATNSLNDDSSLKVYCVTGVDTADPIGAQVGGIAASLRYTTTAFTAEADSSLAFVVANDFKYGTTPAVADGFSDSYRTSGEISGASGWKALAATAGQPVTFDISIAVASGGTPAWNYLAFEVRAAAGTPHAQTLTDPLGGLDDATGVQTFAATLTDPLGGLDATTQAATTDRALTDPAGLLDAAAGAQGHAAALTDALGLLDAATGATGLTATLTDALGLLDGATGAQAAARPLTDPLGALDAAAQAATTERALTDPAGLLDAAAGVQVAAQGLTDALGLLDGATGASAAARGLTDALGLLDGATALAGQVLTVTDVLGLLDSAAGVQGAERGRDDVLGLLDPMTFRMGVSRSPRDVLGFLDAAEQQAEHVRELADALGLLDPVSAEVAATDYPDVSAGTPVRVQDVRAGSPSRTGGLVAGRPVVVGPLRSGTPQR